LRDVGHIGTANQEIRDWWHEKKKKIEHLIDKMGKVTVDADKSDDEVYIEWYNTYVELLKELADLPLYNYFPPFCELYMDYDSQCVSCPIGNTKGVCHISGSLMDIAIETMEKLRNIIELFRLEKLPED